MFRAEKLAGTLPTSPLFTDQGLGHQDGLSQNGGFPGGRNDTKLSNIPHRLLSSANELMISQTLSSMGHVRDRPGDEDGTLGTSTTAGKWLL